MFVIFCWFSEIQFVIRFFCSLRMLSIYVNLQRLEYFNSHLNCCQNLRPSLHLKLLQIALFNKFVYREWVMTELLNSHNLVQKCRFCIHLSDIIIYKSIKWLFCLRFFRVRSWTLMYLQNITFLLVQYISRFTSLWKIFTHLNFQQKLFSAISTIINAWWSW